MTSTPSIISQRFVFHGRVQGVGFRQRTRSIARRFPVVGYVKNLADGTVELVVQGPVAGVEGLVQELEADFSGSIVDRVCENWSGEGEFSGFDIRF